MARTGGATKTSSVPCRTTAVTPCDVSVWRGDLENWPRSWMVWEKDLPPGESLVACFRPFIEQLASCGLSRRTVRRHVDNLWRLGGEIIRDLHEDPSLRRLAAQRLLTQVLHEDGGPLIHNGSEEEQRSFDSTCRRLHRFLTHRRP
jgi:hypothetical protein